MPETIGKQLKLAREARNLPIQKVVQATHIRALYIEALEDDDYESLPSPVQARAFLKLYAEFLGLSLDEVITHQRDGVSEPPPLSSDLSPAPAERRTYNEKLGTLQDRIKQAVLHPPKKPSLVRSEDTPATSSTEGQENEQPAASPEVTPALPDKALPSQSIFSSIGEILLQRRESLGLALDEIESHTRLRKHYLLALEAGDFEQLPSSVQARGMLNNYAHFLNLDVDMLLLKFADGLQALRLERQPQLDETDQKTARKSSAKINLPFKIKIPVNIRRYLSVDIFVGGGLVLILLAFAIWGTDRIINLRAGSTPLPTAPPISLILNQTQAGITSTSTQMSSENGTSTIHPVPGETLVLTLPAAGQGPVQVVVIAQEQAWVRVTVDEKVQFEGRVTAGTAYAYDGNNQIEVITGNGRAISILYNQNNLGPMGNLGEVVDHIYTINAILNPTATFTPTATISPTPTITIQPSATLRPSITPIPSSTPRPSATPTISPTPAK